MEEKYITTYKIVVSVGSIIFLILALLVYIEESVSPDWMAHQNTFSLILGSEQKNGSAAVFYKGIKQIEISGTNKIDRCMTCHLGLDGQDSSQRSLPFKNHPDHILEDHDLNEFGCTLCHSGSGRSLIYNETCNPGTVSDWKPVESNCSHCHLIFFDPASPSILPEVIESGRKLFNASGCLGCHRLRETGGRFGPDLTRQGDKIRQGYNFRFVQNEKTVFNWHMAHFDNPTLISPKSIMPDFSFDQKQKQSITTFILGLSQPQLPFRFYTMDVLKEFKGHRKSLAAGESYSIICRACHGENGLGRDYKNEIFGVPGLANTDFQAVASTDMIAFLIEEGRSDRYMPSWKSRQSGLLESEIIGIIRYVRSLRAPAPTFEQVHRAPHDGEEGAQLYAENCRPCHGSNLSGEIGPSLNSQSFSLLASDLFLYKTLVSGRANTAMPAWSRFNAQAVKSLIRFIQPQARQVDERKTSFNTNQSIGKGQNLYHYRCSRCHGEEGQGGIGPGILKHDFLEAAGDAFLIGMVTQGRDHTPMFNMKQDKSDLASLIQFMRSKQDMVSDYIDPGPALGNQTSGERLYKNFCKKCHGRSGEGIEAPALNNQEFLNAATNGYILATITMGREKTPMPAWGKIREDQRALTGEERQNITSFIRNWQKIKIRRKLINMSSQN